MEQRRKQSKAILEDYKARMNTLEFGPKQAIRELVEDCGGDHVLYKLLSVGKCYCNPGMMTRIFAREEFKQVIMESAEEMKYISKYKDKFSKRIAYHTGYQQIAEDYIKAAEKYSREENGEKLYKILTLEEKNE